MTPPAPLPQPASMGGMTGDKARVTDSDRAVIPSVRARGVAASLCVTLSDRVESCARGGMMQPLDRRWVHGAGLFHMHTNDRGDKCKHLNVRSYINMLSAATCKHPDLCSFSQSGDR